MPRRTRIARCLVHVAAISALLLQHRPALADVYAPLPTATILLVAPPDDPTAMRVAAEIRAIGLAVESVQGGPTAGGDPELRSSSAHFVARVEMEPGVGKVWIWTVDRSSGQSLLRSVVPLDADPAVVALRVVEVLRASLQAEGGLGPREGASHEAPVGDGVGAPVTATPRLGAALGPAFAWGSRQFSGSWEGLGSVYWLWTPVWGAEALGVAPLTSAQRVVSAGSGTLIFGLVAGGLRVRALTAGWCVLDVSAGMGAATIHTRGFPKVGYSGTDASTWVGTPYARVGWAVSIAHHFWVRADVAGALAIPRPAFTFAGEAASSWGLPLLLASLGIEVVFR
jgi:hypothetical protein